jgi:hypothetical protein
MRGLEQRMKAKSNDRERVMVGSAARGTPVCSGRAERAPDDAELHCLKTLQDGEKADYPIPPDIAVIAASRLESAAARSAALLTVVPEVNLAYRPKTYFWSSGVKAHLPALARRSSPMTALQRFIVGDHLDESPKNSSRQELGADLKFEEVMIAQITILSTTRDVTCIYARIANDCIHYEVVDEYSGDTLSGPSECTSLEPLTLAQLETFLNGAWSIYDVLEMNFGHLDFDAADVLYFVETIDSEFYPELDRLYRARITAWALAGLSASQQGGDRAAA